MAALAFTTAARAVGPTRGRALVGAGLFGAALIYLAFALAAGAPGRALALEGAGVLAFGLAAWRGARVGSGRLRGGRGSDGRGAARWLAAGWALHAAWDWPLHAAGHPWGAYPPAWYPPFCAAFDVAVAGALGWAAWRTARRPTPAAER